MPGRQRRYAAAELPAFYPEVVSVAATDNRDRRVVFSTFNNGVEVAGPGVGIVDLDGRRLPGASATSTATPHAAGAAPVIAGRYPADSPSLWRAKLDRAVDDIGPRRPRPADGPRAGERAPGG